MNWRGRGLVISAAVAACAVAPVAASAASAASQYLYERTLMGAADGRCHLFTPDIGRALSAARAQARNAALRAGDGSAAVAATERRALAKAATVDCRSSGLRLAADRLRAAFADYAKLQVLSFPGVRAGWRAERPYPAYHGAPRWGLAQSVVGQGGWMVFGITGGQVTLLDARGDSAPAPIARIVFGILQFFPSLMLICGEMTQPIRSPPPPFLRPSSLKAGPRRPARCCRPAPKPAWPTSFQQMLWRRWPSWTRARWRRCSSSIPVPRATGWSPAGSRSATWRRPKPSSPPGDWLSLN